VARLYEDILAIARNAKVYMSEAKAMAFRRDIERLKRRSH
jgi:hypothetical protein